MIACFMMPPRQPTNVATWGSGRSSQARRLEKRQEWPCLRFRRSDDVELVRQQEKRNMINLQQGDRIGLHRSMLVQSGVSTIDAVKRLAFCVLVGVSTGCASPAGSPQEQAPVTPQNQGAGVNARSSGLAYAERACATCHAVNDDQLHSPDPKAPAFEVIANTPGMTIMALNVWLHSPHKDMPLLRVEPDKLEDLSAYLYMLKERKAEPG